MAKQELTESELDGLFAAARDRTPGPSADLMARVLADAGNAVAPVAPVRRSGVLAAVLEAIGGWPAAAGLATAAVTGLAIGFGTPEALDTLSGGYLASAGYQLEDLLPSYGDLLEEG